jgi:glycosyltransferase involved in cell wall biosynthesis
MSHKKKTIKILYNESHSNKDTKVIAQGGPSRFAYSFRKYFLSQKGFTLYPLLFTHQDRTKPFIRSVPIGKSNFYELVYDRSLLSLNKKEFTKKSLIQYLKPFIQELQEFIRTENPDVVLLNGFSITNWILLYASHLCGVPVVIQHAGIWKKEITVGKDAFSPSMRSIFYDMEKDTVRWCKHHIFLNTFSKDVFMDLYLETRKKDFSSSIVPLSIDASAVKTKKVAKTYDKKDPLNIGVVARWDNIKNHSAILRLAMSHNKPSNWQIHVVTRVPFLSDFAKKYVKHVKICSPMSPEKLKDFYRAMDVVILPSHFDVSPTVVAESILIGTPVIISDRVGWCDEFVRFGLADNIVPREISGQKLINVIYKVMSEHKTKAKKYALFREYIQKTHRTSSVLAGYKKIFLEISAKNSI